MSEKKISGDRGKPAPKWVTIFALCILAATMGTYLIWSRFDDLTVQSSVDHDYKPPVFDLSPASLENYKQKAIAGDAKATAHLYNYYMYQVNDTNASVKVLTMGAERNLADFQMELARHFTSEGDAEEAAKWLSRFEDNPTSAGLLTSKWYSDLYSRLRRDVADGL